MICTPCPPAPVCVPRPCYDDRDRQICELRDQLCKLRADNHGDVRAAQDDVFNSENRYRMLADDKARNECEARLNIDKQCQEVGDNKKQLDELRCLTDQKNRCNQAVCEDLTKCKNLLGDKCVQAHKLREEAHCKQLEVDQDRARLSALHSEIEAIKNDRAAACREIARASECCNQLSCQAAD